MRCCLLRARANRFGHYPCVFSWMGRVLIVGVYVDGVGEEMYERCSSRFYLGRRIVDRLRGGRTSVLCRFAADLG